MKKLLFTFPLMLMWAILFAMPTTVSAQYNYYHSSTAAEGALRGTSDLVRSTGERNLYNSQAAINAESARSANLDNRLKYTQTYFEMRKMNKMYRDEERGPPPSPEQIARMAKVGVPQPLTSSQLDPLVGTIQWPGPLQLDQFKANKEKLDVLFQKRAQNGGTSTYSEFYQIRKITDAMLAQLKSDIKNIPPQDYIDAKKFLESLSYEADSTS